ncbi:glycosyltransferase [Methylocapsa acidiphila]|uniref:glycosyltransferase n=1 Tax=Methylocapsa acidiphila TaxID=133552 RepID=UPI00040B6A84|nr:glycosyltransferase [Methylocapsa acidiphila]
MSIASVLPFKDGDAQGLAGATILQVVPDLQGGPLARATIDVAAALSRVGANALVASRGGRLVSELQAKGGVFVPFPADAKNPLSMLLNIGRLARLIKSEGADLVHVRSRAAAWVAFGATRLTKTPLVTSFPGRYAGGNALEVRYNSILARGDVVLADSAEAAKLIAELYPAAANKIAVARRGVDCKVFSPAAVSPARVQAVRREWKVEAHEPVVLMAATISAACGQKALIEAARILRAQGLAGPKFILAGGEARRGLGVEIDRAIAQAELQDVMRRTGRCADLPAALLAASVLAAPVNQPGGEAVAIEAQAMGAPAIVGNFGAVAETILAPPEVEETQRTGWVVSPGDPAALAAALKAALSLGATARDRLALRARENVERRFSLEQVCADTLAAYRSLRLNGEL